MCFGWDPLRLPPFEPTEPAATYVAKCAIAWINRPTARVEKTLPDFLPSLFSLPVNIDEGFDIERIIAQQVGHALITPGIGVNAGRDLLNMPIPRVG